jgi:hypothetical protein
LASNSRFLLVTSGAFKTRTEMFEEREHLVVPVVALVEGVIHAANAKNAELVTAEEFSRAVGGWDGRPVFEGHPQINGRYVSGNSPEVLGEKRVGIIFNSAVRKGKLTMEAWIDVARCQEVAPELLKRCQAGDPIEISVGVFVETDDSTGEYNGKKYAGAWKDIVPDHLALLVDGDEGACSREMGCGVRAAKKEEAVSDDKKSKGLGSMLARVMSMFRSAQPASEMSGNDLTQKLYVALREVEPTLNWVETFYPVTGPNRVVYSVYEPIVETAMGYPPTRYCLYERAFSLGDNGIVTITGDARVEVEPVVYYEPVLMAEEPTAAAGKRNSAKDQKSIQEMHNHAVALGAYCDPKAATAHTENTSTGASCSCKHEAPIVNVTSEGEEEMNREQAAEFLKNATAEDLKALGVAKVEAPKAQEVPAVAAAAPAAPAVVVPAAPAVAEVKTPTLKDLIASADQDTREAFESTQRAAASKKTETIAALKATGRNPYSDEDLGKMSQVDLDRLVALAGKPVKAAVDFSGQGAARTEGTTEVPAPADLGAAITAARAKK